LVILYGQTSPLKPIFPRFNLTHILAIVFYSEVISELCYLLSKPLWQPTRSIS